MYNFEDIRSYNDAEVNQVLNKLIKEPAFIKVVKHIYPEWSEEKTKAAFSNINSIHEFQDRIIYNTVKKIINTTTCGLYSDGLNSLSKENSYLFITNHRDIILDSAFLNFLLFDNGFNTSQIAIGDNLLIYPWITDIVRLNRSFIVKRNLSRNDFFTESKKLSAYIRQSITRQNVSVWIAQREGRTKNGNDETNPALLKMLDMSGQNDFLVNFSDLNIVPVSISYEYEPCDEFKVRELVNPDYKKSIEDDLQSMYSGIFNNKGNVHYHFSSVLHDELQEVKEIKNKNDQLKLIANQIDDQIYQGYKLWPNNYIAYDLLNNTRKYQDEYNEDEKQAFNNYRDNLLKVVPGDPEVKAKVFLDIYANPVRNKEEVLNDIS